MARPNQIKMLLFNINKEQNWVNPKILLLTISFQSAKYNIIWYINYSTKKLLKIKKLDSVLNIKELIYCVEVLMQINN